jgi:hypothetical protein
VYDLKHQKEKRRMDHFAGLDVSVKETSVCIVDDTGKIVREVKVASEPEALSAVLNNPVYHFKRIAAVGTRRTELCELSTVLSELQRGDRRRGAPRCSIYRRCRWPGARIDPSFRRANQKHLLSF